MRWREPKTCGECGELVEEDGLPACAQDGQIVSEEDPACPLFWEDE